MAKPIALDISPTAFDLPVPEPLSPERVLVVAGENAERGIRGAMATVTSRQGSTPATPGQKLYLAADGRAYGTIGGGALEREVLLALQALVASPEPVHAHRTFRLGASLGMCCGGSADVWIEPLEARTRCMIIGGGHVATQLGPILASCGFGVVVVDAREAWGGVNRPGVESVAGDYDDVGVELPKSAAVIVMTHDHALDQRAIEWAIERDFAFVGGIGSRAKHRRTLDRLGAKGFSAEQKARVRMPLGLDIGARSPAEIAVAIAAELIQWKKGKRRA